MSDFGLLMIAMIIALLIVIPIATVKAKKANEAKKAEEKANTEEEAKRLTNVRSQYRSTEACPKCGEKTITSRRIEDRASSTGVYNYVQCMNCGHEISKTEARVYRDD